MVRTSVKQKGLGSGGKNTQNCTKKILMTWVDVMRREVQEREDICVHVTDSLHCTAETNITL